MELLRSILDHLARDQGQPPRGLAPARSLDAHARSIALLADIAYGPHPRQRLDLYVPHQVGATPTDRLPLRRLLDRRCPS